MKKGEKVISVKYKNDLVMDYSQYLSERIGEHKLYQDKGFVFEQVREKCNRCGKLITFTVSCKPDTGLTLEEWINFWELNPSFGIKDPTISPENTYYHGFCYSKWH